MRITYVICSILLWYSGALAQTLSPEKVKKSADYYWGEYTSPNSQEAEEKALGNLSNQIAVQISSTRKASLKEENDTVDESFSEIIKTYSSATLNNVQTIREPLAQGIYVFRYIAKEEVERIFDERRKLISNMARKAMDYASESQFSQAFKLAYHSMILVQSLPDQRVKNGNHEWSVELPQHINEWINGMNFSVDEIHGLPNGNKEVVLRASYKNRPVRDVMATFWDGYDQMSVRFRQGKARIRLEKLGADLKTLSISINIQQYMARKEIKEVGQLWEFVEKPFFPSTKKIPLEVSGTPSVQPVVVYPIPTPLVTSEVDSWETESSGVLVTEVTTLGEVLMDKKEPIGDAFLKQKIGRAVQYGTFIFPANQPSLVIRPTWDAFEARSIPVQTKYNRIKLSTEEQIVFDIDDKGAIKDLNFGIYPSLYEEIYEAATYSNDWKERQVIVKFMERYRTAYLTRDLPFVEQMFADEAKIIVGRVLRAGDPRNPYSYVPEGRNQPNVEYLEFTKQEYIKRQKRVFEVNEDLFLGFSSFKIIKKNMQKGVYGISLRQHFNADNYADEGHLFLLVDFNGVEPQIYVRAWQPNEWDEATLIGLTNFNVLK